MATGLSPVPAAAAKGLLKLLSYLGVYGLMRRLLEGAPQWWNRLLAALLVGQLITAVIGLRQLYAPIEDLALWADPNSVADGTRRIYSTLGTPDEDSWPGVSKLHDYKPTFPNCALPYPPKLLRNCCSCLRTFTHETTCHCIARDDRAAAVAAQNYHTMGQQR